MSDEDALVGAPMVYTVSATGFPENFDAEGRPDGLTIDTACGVISGAPTAVGNYEVLVSAANGAGTATKNVALTIR